MSSILAPSTQLAPLEQGRGDGIGRLARRTQRGQGHRRTLVAGLIALSVLLGAGSAVFAATMVASDQTVGVQDRFGDAEAIVSAYGVGTYLEDVPVTAADLTAEQRAWLDEHRLDGELPPSARPGPPDVPLEVRQAMGVEPVTVPPTEVLARLDLPSDEVLVDHVAQIHDAGPQARQVTTLDVTHPLAGTTYDTGDRTEPLTGDEALLSPSWLAELGAEVGDTVQLPSLGTAEVVGTATRAARRTQPVAVVAPDRDLRGMAADQTTFLRFADVEAAWQAEQAAQALAQERIAALPEPTTAQLELFGFTNEAEGFTPEPHTSISGVERREDHLAGQVVESSLPTLVGGTVTGLATTVAAIVGACAFAVGIRRRIREIGMLGAIGATPVQLRRLLRREGLVIGLGGAVVGAVLAVVVSFAALPVVERFVDRDLRVVVPVVGTLLPVVVGGLGAYLAAVWPARTASRVPITTALAGRVPLGHTPRWLPVAGALAAATGVALLGQLLVSTGPRTTGLDALQLLVAVLLATLGTAALGVPVIALGGRIADRLPLLGRLALRDAARQRSRSAAAVAALVPVLAMPVAGLTVARSQTAMWQGDSGVAVTEDGVRLETLPYHDGGASTLAVVRGPYLDGRQVPPADDTLDLVTGELPEVTARAEVVHLGAADLTSTAAVILPYASDGTVDRDGGDVATFDRGWGGAWSATPVLATPALLDLLELPADAVPDDGALVLDGTSGPVLPDRVDRLQVVQHDELLPRADGFTGESGFGRAGSSRVFGEVEITRATPSTGGVTPGVLVGPDAAARLGLQEVGQATALRLAAVPSGAQQNALWGLQAPGGVWVELGTAPPFWLTPLGIAVAVALGVLAVVLGVSVVAGMTSALAATESDGDVRKAVALGAAPSLRRRLHGLQAWWHTVIATVLGSALGIAIAWTSVRTLANEVYDETGQLIATERAPLVIEWLPLAGWVLVVPVLVGGVIALVMRSAPVGAPRRRTA